MITLTAVNDALGGIARHIKLSVSGLRPPMIATIRCCEWGYRVGDFFSAGRGHESFVQRRHRFHIAASLEYNRG